MLQVCSVLAHKSRNLLNYSRHIRFLNWKLPSIALPYINSPLPALWQARWVGDEIYQAGNFEASHCGSNVCCATDKNNEGNP